MKFKVIATCEKGHSDEITYSGMSRRSVEMTAALMDGSSEFYLHSPRKEGEVTQIGKCGTCGAQFNCKVEDVPE